MVSLGNDSGTSCNMLRRYTAINYRREPRDDPFLVFDRLPCGFAAFTLIRRPFKVVSFNPFIAASAAELVAISTKPNPLERPENRSVINATELTSPKVEKVSLRSVSDTVNGKLPT